MNDRDDTLRLDVRPEVTAFVSAVRERFSDLSPDERDELLGGLEADLAELVDDQGPGALGDPASYAAELRQAAGLAPYRARRMSSLRGRGPAESVGDLLDWARARSLDALGRLPWGAGDLVTVLRPAWWVLRAWVVVALLNIAAGNGAEVLPTDMPPLGLLLVGAAVLLSTLVGTGRLWPGGDRGPSARVVLLAGNVVCLVAAPFLVFDAHQNVRDAGYLRALDHSVADSGRLGVWMDGRRVCNLEAFDAEGQPLRGVQLLDQDGRPLDVHCDDPWGARPRTTNYPWYLGDVPRWNVFPQAEREQRGRERKKVLPDAYEGADAPAFPVPDRTAVPPVTHPLVAGEAEAGAGNGTEEDGAKGGAKGDAKDGAKDGATKDGAKGGNKGAGTKGAGSDDERRGAGD